ncbi:MAG: replication-relaxation family protein [Actinobacteria bacterium]|nr:replication-relaxation family protein [Actinomycetota bacterium]
MSRPLPEPVPSLGRGGVEILESLGQHRLLSTRQVHDLHTPAASIQWTRRLLARLRGEGLAICLRRPGGLLLWYLSGRGADALEAIPSRAEQRRAAVTPEKAAGPLQEHTLAVNEVGLSFVRAARARGEECGPFDWFHEIAHSLGPPPGRRAPEQLIADAVLTYQLAEEAGGASIAYRFVELDRANRSAAELARRVGRYARLFRRAVPDEDPAIGRVALWERIYPVFPGLLVVLAGRGPQRLAERRAVVLALCRADPELAATPEVEVAICTLADLVSHGPFAPIFRTTAEPAADVDWLGEGGR